ncbi:MAG TPA: hypothetical protein VE860_05930 [Chthoniobacterales bacterium]|jgi:formylglycine-generating enzyme required for sulfatase activity|nr:hypothetical protein [Chthoniobacterales bacterium]
MSKQQTALPEFDIDVAEVTISQYAEFLAAGRVPWSGLGTR